MKWWSKDGKEVLAALQSDPQSGLSSQEALRRAQQQGKNKLSEGDGKKNVLQRFLAQMNDFMVIVLLAAAGASWWVSAREGESIAADSLIIIGIVVLNGIFGVVQEGKAEKALEALKALAAPKARVLRDGKETEISAEDVVQGDILLLEAGDYVAADGRILESYSLQAEESALTGESTASDKQRTAPLKEETPIGDRANMVFAGTYITYGRAKAIATNIGMDTEMGQIAALLGREEESQTPLQKRLARTGKQLGTAALLICGLIFCIGVKQGKDPLDMFMTSVSLAVAAIPEGLPAIVTVVLAVGMQRMSRANAVMRRLSAVETLGSATVICSDKTGTLTQNKMRVAQMADMQGDCANKAEKKEFLLTLAALCSDAAAQNSEKKGEPTECALIEAGQEEGLDIVELREEMKRIGEIPFSSERKEMTTLHHMPEGDYLFITKGAPEVVLAQCSHYMAERGSRPFDSSARAKASALNGALAGGGLRVIAIAFDRRQTAADKSSWEKNLTFAGFFALADPPRPEAKDAVRQCKEAGIRPVMITGDHSLTARRIAQELGIFEKGDRLLTGKELDEMQEEELREAVTHTTVFARVSPTHKVQIVKAFQASGHIAAMTGDGLNDAPALKAADIGCAMGKNGTEVAKSAADLVLADDNFATIVSAVREGRGIYDNIKKAVHFLLSSNIGEIAVIFFAMCFGWATPLLPIQLLWVNLVTDSLPAIALGLQPTAADIMKRKPLRNEASLFSGGMGQKIALEGFMIGALTLLAFAVGHVYYDGQNGYLYARTMAFAVLSLSQLVHAFNMQTEDSLWHLSILENRFLVGAFCIGSFLQMAVIMFPPAAALFGTTPLHLRQWGVVWALSFAPIVLVELEKYMIRFLERKKEMAQQN